MNPRSSREGEDGFDEAPYVLEGSGLTTAPVDGMGSRTRGMRTRVEYKFMKPYESPTPDPRKLKIFYFHQFIC